MALFRTDFINGKWGIFYTDLSCRSALKFPTRKDARTAAKVIRDRAGKVTRIIKIGAKQ